MPELRRILQVEDDPDIQAVVKMALEALGGFEVELADSGQEAIELAGRNRPDLILLDVMMPGMDGPDTLARLRREPELAQVPVIFMTAKVQPSEVAAYRALGVIGVIAKPFDAMTLASLVQAMWESRDQVN
ncbi:MAG: response regulator [Candidatus Nanopelagicales bacterium]|nr:response regulator [Candidatus Nanopelagicales bacterium]